MHSGNRIALEHLQRHDVEGRRLAALEYYSGRDTRLMGFEPAIGAQAPAITGLETWEVELGPRGGEIVTLGPCVAEKGVGHLGADHVPAAITGLGAAETVTVKAGFRVVAAGLQCRA